MVEGNTDAYQSVAMRQNDYLQSPSDPGIVLLKNGATLEYAYMAINGQSNKPWPNDSYWGGFIYAKDAHFINNRWGLQFMKYDKPSYSALINCDFIAQPDAEPAIAIKNWAQTNILVKNCLFDGVAGGVLTYDGQMHISNSQFKDITIGYGRGVWVGGTSPLSSSCTIEGDATSVANNFSNVDQGIYFAGANVNVIDNRFSNNTIDIVGIGNSTYNIRKNRMNNGINGVDLNSTGFFANNRVNCNDIRNKSLGMTITGENYGLKFDGNIFKNNWTDASLYAAADGTFAHVRPQGSLNKPAMNQFTNKDLGAWGFYGNILTKPGNDENIFFTYFYPISPDPATIRTKPSCASNDPCTYNGNVVSQNFQTKWTGILLDEAVCNDGGPFEPPKLAFWEEIRTKIESGNFTAADQLLVNKGSDLTKKARVGLKILTGDLAGAKNVLDAYSTESGADDEFVGVQQINIDRLAQGDKYSLSSKNRDFLLDVAIAEGENAGYANSLLFLLEGVSLDHTPKAINGNTEGGQELGNSESSKHVSVSPNPTSDVVRLDWSAFNLTGKKGYVVIRNRMGLVVKRFEIIPGENWKDIDMSIHEDGIYFYYFTVDGKELDAGQIVLSKN